MLDFGGKHWSLEVAEVSGRPEFQTCTFQIVDPSLIDIDYDIDTGVETVTGDGVIYEGQARLIGVRSATNYEGATQGNSKANKSLRVQLPHDALPERLEKGFIGRVLEAPLNPSLTNYVYYLLSGIQGASAGSRTLEFNVDGDAVYG